ncbi:MAG: nucleoside recognition domain-containing protein, partial [Verrucomicrobiota bacterium]
MLNYIWLGLILLAVLIGGCNGMLDSVTKEGFAAAEKAVMNLALPLSAIITLWLGIMRLAEKSGMVFLLARAMRPIMRWLFPEVPAEHPAMGAMLMNLAANMLGLNNAATPLGLRAMEHLQKLNPHPGTATNAMCMFLTINTSSIQLIPTTAVGILAIAGSANPTSIVGTAFLATLCSTAVGITAAKIFEKFSRQRAGEKIRCASDEEKPSAEEETFVQPPRTSTLGKIALAVFLLVFAGFFFTLVVQKIRAQNLFPEIFPPFPAAGGAAAAGAQIALGSNIYLQLLKEVINAISVLAIPLFLSFFPLYAALRRVKVYEVFIEGAKEGFQVAIRIIPYLVGILVAVGMFRGAGGIEMLSRLLEKPLNFLGF